jgi:hypothetical protein
MVEAPGVAPIQQRFHVLARMRAFLLKLLVAGTFDVFIDSSGLYPITPESAQFVEAFWRRREPVPDALRGARRADASRPGVAESGSKRQIVLVGAPMPHRTPKSRIIQLAPLA